MKSHDNYVRVLEVDSECADPSSVPSCRPAAPGTGRQSWVQVWHCQLAVALVQTAFVIASIYLKSSLQDGAPFNPVVFAFFREAVAGPILCIIAYAATGLCPKRSDLLHFFGLGLCLYLNQLLYIIGIDMSGVVVATCIQPAIPVFTAMLGVMLGVEHASAQKFAGIALSVAGSICMVLGGALKGGGVKTGNHLMLGNLCLIANTLSMAAYYILCKTLVQRYNPICVTAWAYIAAAFLMGATAVITVAPQHWSIPGVLIGPLIYWILVASILCYYVLTAATRYLPASQVAAFQCLQPFIGTALAFAVLGEKPSVWDLGALGVLAGLLMVVRDR